MGKYLFTTELNKDKDTVTLHLDKAGIKKLLEYMGYLSKQDKNDHIHLLSEEWGDGKLTTEKIDESSSVLHQLNIYYWADR